MKRRPASPVEKLMPSFQARHPIKRFIEGEDNPCEWSTPSPRSWILNRLASMAQTQSPSRPLLAGEAICAFQVGGIHFENGFFRVDAERSTAIRRPGCRLFSARGTDRCDDAFWSPTLFDPIDQCRNRVELVGGRSTATWPGGNENSARDGSRAPRMNAIEKPYFLTVRSARSWGRWHTLSFRPRNPPLLSTYASKKRTVQ